MAQPTTYYSGIDLHKQTSFITTVDPDGTVMQQQKLRNHPEALRRYFKRLQGRHHAVVETTTGWYWLADLLQKQGIALTLAHAKHLKAIAYAKVKTDKVDSQTLADLLRVGLIPKAHRISDELRPLRDVLRTRLRLVERRSAALNSVHRLREKMNVRDVLDLPAMMQLQARCHLEQVALLETQIQHLEQSLHPPLVPNPHVQRLLRIPGIGKTR
jgi:transposase